MIGAIFEFGSEKVEVRVQNVSCFFRSSQNMQFVTIDSLRLDKAGVIKEFPDLENDEEWRTKAIERFKEKLKNMETEKQRIQYVIDDLSKFGYKPLFLQEQGHRPIRLY